MRVRELRELGASEGWSRTGSEAKDRRATARRQMASVEETKNMNMPGCEEGAGRGRGRGGDGKEFGSGRTA